MLGTLLTPLMLATTPATFDMPTLNYDHSSQLSNGAIYASGTLNSNTFNGTQTYAPNGRPSDADGDTDIDPING